MHVPTQASHDLVKHERRTDSAEGRDRHEGRHGRALPSEKLV